MADPVRAILLLAVEPLDKKFSNSTHEMTARWSNLTFLPTWGFIMKFGPKGDITVLLEESSPGSPAGKSIARYKIAWTARRM
jgi:hypothetical protein